MPANSPDKSLEKANQRFVNEWRKQRNIDEKGASALEPQAFWSAARDAIRAYMESSHCGHQMEPSIQLPSILLYEVDLILGEFLAGRIPDKVSSLLTTGAPKLLPIEERARAYAAAYIRAARAGLVKDPHPVKTVRETFEIAPRTASAWAKYTDERPLWLPSQDLPPDLRAQSIAWTLPALAKEYLRRGRSQAGRAKHRPPKRNRPKRGGNESP